VQGMQNKKKQNKTKKNKKLLQLPVHKKISRLQAPRSMDKSLWFFAW
jgi:hypothetical protein